ncbi:MAG TPA: iron-sulfur cluster assembly protein [Anaerolineales bacterium]|nr:iron-sulfur cluster assembly protein [Anaerolineales bacterium]
MSAPETEAKNIVVWEIESTFPQLTDPLKTALREVVDPEIGMDIIQLGLVRNVAIDDQKATITMILTTPFCPYGPAMLEMTRQRAEKALTMPTTIKMGTEMWDFSYMEDGAGADWGLYY